MRSRTGSAGSSWRRAWPATRLRRYGEGQSDPQWGDHILFYEYFHGDNCAGLGASHQTGWTGLVAKAIQLYGFWIPNVHWKLVSRPGSRRKPEPLGKESRT